MEEANLLDFSPSVEAKETTFSEDILGETDLSPSLPGDPNPGDAADKGEAVLLDFEAKYEAPAPLPGSREDDELVPHAQPVETAEADLLVDFEPTKLEEDVRRPDSAEPVDSAERARSR